MDFYDFQIAIVIGILVLGGICGTVWVVWAIWFECTRTIEPKSPKLSQMYRDTCPDDYDDYGEYCDTDTAYWRNQQHVAQQEQMRLDMENESRNVSDFMSHAEFDYEMGVYMHEQACDLAQHDHDSHNDMFNDVGCANPFF